MSETSRNTGRFRERLGPLSFGLWLLTAVILVVAWPRPAAQPDDSGTGDERIEILLDAEQYATLQQVMRGNVEGLHGVLAASASGDMAALEQAARGVADNHPVSTTPSLRGVLPPEWSALGRTVHIEFAALADDARAGVPAAEIPGRLASITTACVTCHRTYRYTAPR